MVRIVMACAVAAALGCRPAPRGEEGLAGAPLPGALSDLYPPKSQSPVYLQGMIRLDSLFSGIVVDLSEEDLPGVAASLEGFKEQYRRLSGMVPEWRAYFPVEPVTRLEAAYRKGDRAGMMAAYGEIGAACHACHAATMVPVQQAFRWGSFRTLAPEDPVLRETTDYATFKHRLSAGLSGIGHDLGQGQTGNARKQFQQFRARLQALKETCTECHGTEIRQYLDARSMKRIDALEAALAAEAVEARAVNGLLEEVGRETCSRCHLVHVPAAFSTKARTR